MAFISSQKSFWKAAASGDMKELEYCLTYNIGNFDKDRQDANGNTAVALAAAAGQLPALARLIQDGCDLDTQNKDVKGPLQLAIDNKHSAAALMLIAAGANVNAHDGNYFYPLHAAATNGDIDVVKALLDKKAELDVQTLAKGRTPLHCAIENEFAPVVRALLAAGANPDIANKEGQSPRDIASAKGKPHLMDLFAPKPVALAPAANQNAPALSLQTIDDTEESWTRSGKNRLSHIGTYPELNRRITEIFNFETRERTVIAENLKTGADTLTPPESFDNVSEDALRRALKEFNAQGGTADEAFVMGTRKPRRDIAL